MAQGSPAIPVSTLGNGTAPRRTVDHAVGVLKAVGHPLRFRIVDLLAKYPALSVSQLCNVLETKQPIISQQLSILRRGNVVNGRRAGNRVLYSLASERVGELVRLFHSGEVSLKEVRQDALQ